MNKRFKFRAWWKPNYRKPIMLYDVEKTYDFMRGKPESICADSFGEVLENEDYIVMQCTGLKDKNGKLIYEGDVLGGKYENLDIFYCPQCMQFELHAKGYGCMCCNGDIHWCEVVEDNNKLEVIGNIYKQGGFKCQ